MKLKSYISNTAGANQVREVRVVLATDASPGAGWTLLGNITHEPVDDNASGHQKHDISHVIYQHVQEQVYLQLKLQDMQRINITHGGEFKLLERVLVDQGENRLGIGFEHTIKVSLVPTDATTDGVSFWVSQEGVIEEISHANGQFKFKTIAKGETTVRIRVGNFEQVVPIEVTEELPSAPTVVPVDSITVPAGAITLTAAAPTFQLVPTVLPANATNKGVTYVSGTPATATVSATGLVTRVANGSTNITITAKDGSGKSAVKAVTATD